MAVQEGESEEVIAGNRTAQDNDQSCTHSGIRVCPNLCPLIGSCSDLLYSHDLKDVKQKAEQIQNLLTGKNDFLTGTFKFAEQGQKTIVKRFTTGLKPLIHLTSIIDLRSFTSLELLLGCFEPLNGLSGSKESIVAFGSMVSLAPESRFWRLT